MFRGSKIGLRLALTATALCCCSMFGAGIDPASGAGDMPLKRDFTYRQRQLDRTKEGRELYRTRVSVPDASQPDAPRAAWIRNPSVRFQPSVQFDAPATGWSGLLQTCLLAGAMIFVAVRIVRKFGARFATFVGARFWPSEASAGAIAGLSAKVRAEEAAFSEFVSAFRVGLAKPAGTEARALHGAAEPETRNPASGGGADSSAKGFLAWAPVPLAKLKGLLQELGRSADDGARQGLLGELAGHVQVLKERADVPELLPVWQIAAALEGLVKQFHLQRSTVTPSTLRTVASALDLLDELCQGGWAAAFAQSPAIRLLVVDDDLISRRAVSFALKRAFNQPDLAESGEAALPLVEKQPYDMIFLDVQMPGMDGFEVCSKIHATAANRSTPVVFVTCHSDFEARTKAIVSGGNDLIAKPFLSFELTLKALVSILRARLREAKSGARAEATAKPAKQLAENSMSGRAGRRGKKRIARRRSERLAASANFPVKIPAAHLFSEESELKGGWLFRGHRRCQAL
jgi:CheY-like chemotaxis protein